MDAKCPIPLKRVNMRGYFGVGLDNPKNSCNIAAALRACGVYDAGFLATSGKRYKRNSIDTGSSYRHLPYFQVEDLRTIIPYDCIPVAVDIIPEAKNLITFSHPERAFYIFGQEDGTLGERILSWCPLKVMIPTKYCMNLAACVNVVLYDRISKEARI